MVGGAHVNTLDMSDVSREGDGEPHSCSAWDVHFEEHGNFALK